MVKKIKHPTLGSISFGRKQSIGQRLGLSLGSYLTRSLPAPPDDVDYSPLAMPAIAQVYGNDVEGDCTSAGPAHTIGVFTGNVTNTPVIFTLDQVNAFYSLCEGPPGYPAADNGADIPTVLNVWREQGYLLNGEHRIVGSLNVNAADPEEMRIAIYLFGNLVYGANLPNFWVDPAPTASGFVWDDAGKPIPDNGHCFVACGYQPGQIKILTWGMWGWITDAASSKYAVSSGGGELHVVLSRDWLKKARDKAPNGVRWEQLAADFSALGSSMN